MGKAACWLGFYVLSVLLLCMEASCSSQHEERKVYIVYMGALPEGTYSVNAEHLSILQQVVEKSSASDSLIRSYSRSFNGFAANLTSKEAQRLSNREGVVSVFPSRTLHVKTTRSWDFVGLSQTAKRQKSLESNIIIGVIDTGAWPELESFSDKGFGPPPKKWNGACRGGSNFTCNNKLIGARYYRLSKSARDDIGHGSHTASTAAGNIVKGASFFGLGEGTARGGVPSARIAVYKVCSAGGFCSLVDVLAAFDDAVADGVDIITVSLGSDAAFSFDQDGLAIGAFHAMEKGILTTHAAGNNGPSGVTSSVAPWLFTVAAGSTDRLFTDTVVFGNGMKLEAKTINSFPSITKNISLVYGHQVASANCSNESFARSCDPSCLDPKKVKGKILLCDVFFGSDAAAKDGAVGAIVSSDVYPDVPFLVPLPAASIPCPDFSRVLSYLNSTKNPQAHILKTVASKNEVYPRIASFSSRGPNIIVRDIMKPDITAPGVNILAAFSPIVSPSEMSSDKRRVKFNLMSGTSMACPHVAGVAAYVKSFHPDWSPSAIKSAIMTSAKQITDEDIFPISEFAYGSGFISPLGAVHPGLVYEIEPEDYTKFLYWLGYNATLVSRHRGGCPKGSEEMSPAKLNLPYLMFEVPAAMSFEVSITRTVKNVGLPNSTYKSTINGTFGTRIIEVIPSVLSFVHRHEKKNFTVKISGSGVVDGHHASAVLTWADGKHTVNTPIIYYGRAK